MAVKTFSKFYYIEPVTPNNLYLNFSEDGINELVAEIAIGQYTMDQLTDAVENALNTVGSDVYTVTLDRDSRHYTITSTGTFEILAATGSQIGADYYQVLGFSSIDLALASSHTSDVPAGSVFSPQFYIQDYVKLGQNQEAVSGVQAVTTDGRVEVVSFGTQNFIEMNIKYQNNLNNTPWPIRPSATGYDDLKTFLEFATRKIPMEFMEDINISSAFTEVILDKTDKSNIGLGFMIRELTGINLPDFYESGKLVFRVINF